MIDTADNNQKEKRPSLVEAVDDFVDWESDLDLEKLIAEGADVDGVDKDTHSRPCRTPY